MIRRVFIDGDVILDLLLAREPFFPAATRFFLLVQEGKIQGCVSPLIFSNLFYVLRKQLSASEALTALRKLKLLTQVLPVDERTIDLALASEFKDFEDAIQYYVALSNGIDAIITRNKRDYKASKLPLLTAEECVELLLSSH
jgi:predicted nucleic acid-binding protein